MPKPITDIQEIRRKLEREGWMVMRDSGPHTIYGKGTARVVVPKGRGDLKTGTALNINKTAGWL
jgi:predicted RNA binding protein YcfA (HicA-like mRNA interferase family)